MQLRFKKYSCRILLLICAAASHGCGTVPQPKPLTAEEQIHVDSKVGVSLAKDFDAECTFRRESKVEAYLQVMARKLADAVPEFKTTPISVVILADRNKRWHDYGLPGNRIYISVGLLRGLEFENQIAAAIAFELGHIAKRHAVLHLERGQSSPDLHGIFAYTEEEDWAAAAAAADILYNAGFDPRGMVSLWEHYRNNLQHSPYKTDTLLQLMEKTRQAVAQNTPLRNPIVRSQAFLEIRRRIRTL